MSRFARRVAIACCVAGLPAPADDRVAALGKERAARSAIEWEARESVHPLLGAIHFALPRSPIATAVGISRVSSRAYISCERASATIAIELANASAPDDPGGLLPVRLPQLVCHQPGDGRRIVAKEIAAQWAVNELGDLLARGLSPATLRSCVAIGVEQEVRLPKGWGKPSAKVAFEIPTYAREVDAVFATCGEEATHAVAAAPPTTTAPPVPAPPPAPPARAAAPAAPESPAAAATGNSSRRTTAAAWQRARTVAGGRTNVRARPTTDAEAVAQLPPNTVVLVQKAHGDWWRVRPSAGGTLEGFVRQDRLVIR